MKLWGTRGSIPTPGAGTIKYGGNTACVEVTWGESGRVIFDAGTGIRLLGEQLATDGNPPKRIDILFSHLHWDHIQGLPFFIPLYVPGVDLHLWGSGRKGLTLDRMLDHQLHSAFFPVGRAQLAASILFHLVTDEPFEIDEALITPIRVNHPGGGFAFRLEVYDKVFIYATDREVPREDSVQENAFQKFAAGADLLIHDAQYSESEYAQFRQGWGHSSRESALEVARRSSAKRVILFHHDPSHTDDQLDAAEEESQKLFPDLNLSMAVEGVEITL